MEISRGAGLPLPGGAWEEFILAGQGQLGEERGLGGLRGWPGRAGWGYSAAAAVSTPSPGSMQRGAEHAERGVHSSDFGDVCTWPGSRRWQGTDNGRSLQEPGAPGPSQQSGELSTPLAVMRAVLRSGGRQAWSPGPWEAGDDPGACVLEEPGCSPCIWRRGSWLAAGFQGVRLTWITSISFP